uniref:Riboflavin transporter n=1 Tax=Glossina pallidipes TaxID=7398 RepID=A0A1A9ZX36_GLOPL
MSSGCIWVRPSFRSWVMEKLRKLHIYYYCLTPIVAAAFLVTPIVAPAAFRITTTPTVAAATASTPSAVASAPQFGHYAIFIWTLLIGLMRCIKLSITTVMHSQGVKSLLWTGCVVQPDEDVVGATAEE